jgi:hypothetical protein
MTLLMSYELDGTLYETSSALSLSSIEDAVKEPSILHAKLVKLDDSFYTLLMLQEGVAVLDLTDVLSPPSFWTEEALLSLLASCVVLTMVVRCLPYMRNGHRMQLAH